MEIYKWYFLNTFILLKHWSYFPSAMFWTKKINFDGEIELHILNNPIFVEKSFKTRVEICTHYDEWK
jgi:hypothetical protein